MVWVDTINWAENIEIDEKTGRRHVKDDAPEYVKIQYEKYLKSRDPKRKIRVE